MSAVVSKVLRRCENFVMRHYLRHRTDTVSKPVLCEMSRNAHRIDKGGVFLGGVVLGEGMFFWSKGQF